MAFSHLLKGIAKLYAFLIYSNIYQQILTSSCHPRKVCRFPLNEDPFLPPLFA